jgi:predicted transport protein
MLETRKSKILVHRNLNPKTVKLVPGFTRDMRKIGHWGTGDLQVAISTQADFERAKPLMVRAFEGLSR